MGIRLHILPDEKIINRTITYFEKVWPGQNKYIVIIPKSKDSCKYVDIDINDQIKTVHYNSNKFWNEIGNVDNYCAIIVHYLTLEAAKFILKIKHNNISWIEWGGDMYNSFLARKGFQLYSNSSSYNYNFFNLIYNKLKNIITKRRFNIRYKAVFKIKYFIPDSMYGEYPLFLKYYPEFSHLQYKEFFYYPIQEIIGDINMDRRISGSSIMIGNSASKTNNHCDVINLLSSLGIGNKIIIPLSYGAEDDYADFVIRFAKEQFGNLVSTITEYLPLNVYNELFFESSYFIYANYRQEAVGNIIFALYIGGKVFLRKDNPLFEFYKGLGLVIFAFEEIDYNSFNTPLSYLDYINNKNIIESYYSNERMLLLIKQSFSNESN